MEEIKNFFMKYRGAIIGALIAILILCTGFYKLMIAIILICIGLYVGNYIQINKNEVKEKMKNFIDKL
ncbi:MAG: DUF2273 domain-containing protein [Clostridiaceae bacterium]|nr:DUF2273 domain-containing protein [Clostridiaceae bacterium]